MLARILTPPARSSFFLFGPRGTGKSTWARTTYPDALYIDLLDDATFTPLLAQPSRLEAKIDALSPATVVIDEVQKLPALLDQVHRLIEQRGIQFVLTGSSARKLRRAEVNLLAGRALTLQMHPLTAIELGPGFELAESLRYGHLPGVQTAESKEAFLRSYVGTYLREEVQQEALVRNLPAFARFLEAASFSQAGVLNLQTVSNDCGVPRKTVETHFQLLEDLLLARRLPVFQRRARRSLTHHPKFYYFDAGVYRAIRPRGPLDLDAEIEGAALETLVLQEITAVAAARQFHYDIAFWRTHSGAEVDFVLYGECGFIAIEVKRSALFRSEDLKSLRLFREDYPEARAILLYGGHDRYRIDGIEIWPVVEFLRTLPEQLGGESSASTLGPP
jgi:predicted AAA+ superfamily ATPase